MSTHAAPYALAGRTLILKVADAEAAESVGLFDGEYRVEDWWDRVSGGVSWMWSEGNWAALNYGRRNGLSALPLDDEVVYGKQKGLGHIVHVSELFLPEEVSA